MTKMGFDLCVTNLLLAHLCTKSNQIITSNRNLSHTLHMTWVNDMIADWLSLVMKRLIMSLQTHYNITAMFRIFLHTMVLQRDYKNVF